MFVEFALWIFVHGQHLLKPLRLNFVGSFAMLIECALRYPVD